jgi:colanic acid biosynthesis glycosyl transferase WcaI
MRILLMAQHYAPEEVSGAVLATELAEDLAARGHQVSFVTCAPNYPLGRLFSGYRNRLLSREQRNGVEVVRSWSYITASKGFVPRILNYGTFSATAFYAGLATSKPDVIFSYSPPLPLGLSAWLLSRLWRIPWVLRVEDLYPDAAVAAGVLRNRQAIGFFAWLEKFIYRRAGHISLIAEAFRLNLLAKGVPGEKLSVTPVWADPNLVQPLPKENAFRSDHGLQGRFVVMYAGALGYTSSLEDVIEAAHVLNQDERIRFVIVGEGVKKAALMTRAKQLNLNNVLFLGFQPRERFAEMLAAADVNLVTLNPDSASFSLPNKTFNIMASARPILAVTPDDSEIARIVREGECGLNVPAGQPEQLVAAIQTLRDDPARLAEMGQRGRKLLEARFARERCVDAFEDILLQEVQDR